MNPRAATAGAGEGDCVARTVGRALGDLVATGEAVGDGLAAGVGVAVGEGASVVTTGVGETEAVVDDVPLQADSSRASRTGDRARDLTRAA